MYWFLKCDTKRAKGRLNCGQKLVLPSSAQLKARLTCVARLTVVDVGGPVCSAGIYLSYRHEHFKPQNWIKKAVSFFLRGLLTLFVVFFTAFPLLFFIDFLLHCTIVVRLLLVLNWRSCICVKLEQPEYTSIVTYFALLQRRLSCLWHTIANWRRNTKSMDEDDDDNDGSEELP